MNNELLCDARIFSNRTSLLNYVSDSLPTFDVVAEIGVAYGGFTEHILQFLSPKIFHAFDKFDLHTYPVLFGADPKTVFGPQTHWEYYRNRFPDATTWEGDSWEQLKLVDADMFDFAYLDAAHDYDSVSKDIFELNRAMRPGGIVMFDDYTNYDVLASEPFGVMAAVNEYIESGCVASVVGVSLSPDGFHNIAVRLAK